MKIYAYCWASGLIQFGTRVPRDAIAIARGEPEVLVTFIAVVARHSYDGKTLLVPGVPEAPMSEGDAEKGVALDKWLAWIDRKPGKPEQIEVFLPTD